MSVTDGVAGARRVLGVGERGGAAGGVVGAVGRGGAEVGGRIAGHRRGDSRPAEGGGGAGRERRAGAAGGRVDPDRRARLGRALDLGVVVVGGGVGVGVGDARGRGSGRVALDPHHARDRWHPVGPDQEEHVVAGRRDVRVQRRGRGDAAAAGSEVERHVALLHVHRVRHRAQAGERDLADRRPGWEWRSRTARCRTRSRARR